MKTLNELRLQAENMFFRKMQDPCSPLADLASRLLFRAGWSAAAEELLRWHDPKKELPEEGEDVLIKLITGQCEVGRYIEHVNWRGTDGIVDDYIAGWRPIIELPEDGEK